MITVERKTTESVMKVVLNKGDFDKNYREKINTPIPFLSHMIEQVVWRSGINLDIDVKLDKFNLAHLVCEDLGMTVGKAVHTYKCRNNTMGYGDAIGIIDEARALVAISFEERAALFFDKDVSIVSETEGMLSEDLVTFLDGFVQGANCTMHINLQKGENGHHIWEAIFRGVGIALGRALDEGVGRTAGVAGEIKYEIS